mgnify:CR=1 FL=1
MLWDALGGLLGRRVCRRVESQALELPPEAANASVAFVAAPHFQCFANMVFGESVADCSLPSALYFRFAAALERQQC